jgi:hypothetical protein
VELHLCDAIAAKLFQAKVHAWGQLQVGRQNGCEGLLPIFGLVVAGNGLFQRATIAQVVFEGAVQFLEERGG